MHVLKILTVYRLKIIGLSKRKRRRKTLLFIIASNTIKYLGINLTEEEKICKLKTVRHWLKKLKNLDWSSSVGWALSCKPKGHQFDSQSGHMPGLQDRSLVGGVVRGNQSIFLPLSFFLPSPVFNSKYIKSPPKMKKQANQKITYIHWSKELTLLKCPYYSKWTAEYQNSNGIFHRNRKTIQKLVWDHERIQTAKPKLRKKSKSGGILLPNFKLHYNTIVIKTVSYWHRNRQIDQCNRVKT